MLEAVITKAVVVHEDKVGTVLYAVAEYYDDIVNVRVPYDWETLDQEAFIEDLREKLAEDFDLPVYRVDVFEEPLLRRMKDYAEKAKTHGMLQ